MHNFRRHARRLLTATGLSGAGVGAGAERELMAVDRQLHALQRDYLALGMRASRLAAARDRDLAARDRSEACIGVRQTGQPATTDMRASGAERPTPAPGRGARGSARPVSRTGYRAGPMARALHVAIRAGWLPTVRPLAGELASAHRELAEIGDACRRLTELTRMLERECARADRARREAQARAEACTAGASVTPARAVTCGDGVADDGAERLAAASVQLGRLRTEKIDLAIQLLESQDSVEALRREQAQLQAVVDTLDRQLADTGRQDDAIRRERQELEVLLAETRRREALLEQRNADLQRALAASRQATRLAAAAHAAAAPARPSPAAAEAAEPDAHPGVRRRFRLAGAWSVALLGVTGGVLSVFYSEPGSVSFAAVSGPFVSASAEGVAADEALQASAQADLAADPAPASPGMPESGDVPFPDTENDAADISDGTPGAAGEAAAPLSVFASTGATRNTSARGAGVPLVRVWLMGKASGTAGNVCLTPPGQGGDAKACAFLERHMLQEGVIRLPGGVQYTVIRNGSGASPRPEDTVEVNFRAMLLDGTEFDSTRRRGGHARFRVDETIPGLQDVLQHMEEGAHWKVYIPGELAFRKPAPFGGQIVVYDIELVSIVDTQDAVPGTM